MTDTLTPATELAAARKPMFRNETPEYAAAMRDLLAVEIEARRTMTRLAERRRALPPGPRVEKDYRFRDADGRELSLADLFGDHDTLVTYFWMYGPARERPCPMCTNTLGGLDGNAVDIRQRVAFKVIGRSPVARQLQFARERGWDHLEFVETIGDDYARDLGALTPEGDEYPAWVVYVRDGDGVRVFVHAEMPADAADPGQDPRGAVDLAPLWTVLDWTPAGRGEDWYPKLDYGEAA